MWLIKKYYNESEYVSFTVTDIADFMRENITEFKRGYRFYSGTVAVCNDITENPNAIIGSKEILMMRPAYGDPVSLIIGAIVASIVVAAVAVKLLTPKVDAQANQNRSQASATNSLGDRTNEAAPGSRRDDVWGRVNGTTPRLIQVPHRRFEDDSEVEIFAWHGSNGKIAIDNVKDGATSYSSLTGAKFNAWWPGGNPNHPTNTTPDITIGGLIDRPLVNVTESNELQADELLPPNDLTISGISWRLSTIDNLDGTWTATLTGTNLEAKDISLTDYVNESETFLMQDFVLARSAGSVEVYFYTDLDTGDTGANDFNTVTSFDLSGQYLAETVDSTTVTFTTTNSDFAGWVDAGPSGRIYSCSSSSDSFETTNSDITEKTYYSDDNGNPFGLSSPITVTTEVYLPAVGNIGGATVGPIRIPDEADALWLNLVADNGFYKLVENNDRSVSSNVEITFSARDENDLLIGTDTVFNQTFSSNSNSVTKQSAISVDFTKAQWDVEPLADYYVISARRTTNRDKSSDTTSVDKVVWRDCYFSNEIGDQDYGDVTMGQAVIPSSPEARSAKERRLNFDATRYIEPYLGNGVFGPSAPVETWAETLIAVSLDKLNGRLQIEEIDADLLLSVQEQLIDYYGSPDYVKVGYVLDSTKLRFQDIYSLFCDAVNVKGYAQGSTYKAYPDIKREQSSKQFTHRNKIQGQDTRERFYERDYDGVELKYRSNESATFETVVYHVNGTDSYNRLEIELSGATQEIQARTRALRELNIIKYQSHAITLEADGIGRLTVPGERVDNVDTTRIVKRETNTNVYAIYDGQVVSQNGLEIELSQPIEFTEGETHTIRFTSSKGDLLEAIECTAGSTKYHVVLANAPTEAIYTGYKREKTSFTLSADNLRHSLPIIVRATKAKETSGVKTRQISGINFDERYYQDDKNFAV